jgi:hypothetical protein
VLRAAPGHRVVLSGFAPILDWKPAADGLYTATIDRPIGDLYVGLEPQPVSRWPDLDEPMRLVSKPDSERNCFEDGAPFPAESFVGTLAAEPGSAQVFLFLAAGNYYSTLPISRVNIADRAITLAPSRGFSNIKGEAGRYQDRYQFANHRALIRKPGQWAFETISDKQTRVYFRPNDPADLAHTQYRQASEHLLLVDGGQTTISHIRIEGLEICGSAGNGLEISRADHVTATRCITHNNAGSGIWVRRTNDVEVRNNISVLNGGGMSVASSQHVLVEGNEIALNLVDGIDVAGNVTGRPGGEPDSAHVTLKRNYIHHHLYMSHPDNVQSYRWVRDFTIEDNVLLFGGQAIMTEEVDGGTLRNTVAVGTAAVVVIFGHENSDNWTVEHNTVGLGGWGAFSFTGKDYRLRNNIVWNNALGLSGVDSSDGNLFLAAHEDWAICQVSGPRWRNFVDLADVVRETHQEEHSRRARPVFRHAPFSQAAMKEDEGNRANRLSLRLNGGGTDIADFQPGDRVEINGDGLLRRITAVDAGAIEFDPPLPRRPLRDALVWNWKNASSTALDLRLEENGSPADTITAGATIDIPAFQRGDFDGDGQRDIPELPDDLKASTPSPNAMLLPLRGN